MKERTFNFSLTLVTVLIIGGFFGFKIYQSNKIKESLPYLTVGEKLKKLEIIGIHNQTIDESILVKSKIPVLMFIFSRPCSPCDRNVTFWNKMAELLSNKAISIGVIVGDPSVALSFSEKVKLNFDLFVPKDINRFIKSFRLKLNYSQTIVFLKSVRIVKVGELSNKNASEIITVVKNMSNPNGKR